MQLHVSENDSTNVAGHDIIQNKDRFEQHYTAKQLFVNNVFAASSHRRRKPHVDPMHDIVKRNINKPFVILDRHKTIQYFNDKLNITEYLIRPQHDTLYSMVAHDSLIFHGVDRAIEEIEKTYRTKRPSCFELIAKRSGHKVAFTVSPIIHNGEFCGVLLIANDRPELQGRRTPRQECLPGLGGQYVRG